MAIVGASPVGLLLAAELALAGVVPTVLERRAELDPQPKARGIGPLAVEALRRRGLGPALEHTRQRPLTIEELTDSVERVTGHRITISNLRDSRRFSDAARQVTTCHTGRVLVGGDAAHASCRFPREANKLKPVAPQCVPVLASVRPGRVIHSRGHPSARVRS